MNGFLLVNFNGGQLIQFRECVPHFGLDRQKTQSLRNECKSLGSEHNHDAYTIATLLYSSCLFLHQGVPGASISTLEFGSTRVYFIELEQSELRLLCLFDYRVPEDLASHLCASLKQQYQHRKKVSLHALSIEGRFCFLKVSAISSPRIVDTCCS